MTNLEQFDRAAAAVTTIIDAVGPDQLTLPTACSEWDVRAVINHLAVGNAKTVSWAHDTPPPPDDGRLGADVRAAFTESVARAREVLAEPGLFEREVRTPFGVVPGALLLHMRINEYLAHGWDVADATGQPTDFAPDLAEQALAAWRARMASMPREAGGPFAPERVAPAGAAAADRLAAFLGRTSVRTAALPDAGT